MKKMIWIAIVTLGALVPAVAFAGAGTTDSEGGWCCPCCCP